MFFNAFLVKFLCDMAWFIIACASQCPSGTISLQAPSRVLAATYRIAQGRCSTFDLFTCQAQRDWQGLHSYKINCRPPASFASLVCFTLLRRNQKTSPLSLHDLCKPFLSTIEGREALQAEDLSHLKRPITNKIQKCRTISWGTLSTGAVHWKTSFSCMI